MLAEKPNLILLAGAREGGKEETLAFLRRTIERIESGDMAHAELGVAIIQCTDPDKPDGDCFYKFTSSGMRTSQALWLLEMGKKYLLEST